MGGEGTRRGWGKEGQAGGRKDICGTFNFLFVCSLFSSFCSIATLREKRGNRRETSVMEERSLPCERGGNGGQDGRKERIRCGMTFNKSCSSQRQDVGLFRRGDTIGKIIQCLSENKRFRLLI